MTTVGVLHPGEMGTAIGSALRAAGHDVIWAGDGRSAATRARAVDAGLRDTGSLGPLCATAAVVVSVCPPDAALTVATAVTAEQFTGTYVDANAIAPSTARRIDELVRGGGASYVDGGIIGGPAAPRLCLSGAGAAGVAALFGAPVDTAVVDAGPYAASALKMVYAGWTKGTTALLLAIAATAERLGVADDLRCEWERSLPGVAQRLGSSAGAARKAWRWRGEMHEIARTMDEAGLPGEFHEGAAEVFRRLASLDDAPGVTIDDVLTQLLED